MAFEENDRGGLVEALGRWIFPVAGCTVTQVSVDYALGITVDGRVRFRISCPFEYEIDGATLAVDPESTADLGQFVVLHKTTVVEAYSIKDGHLVVSFDGGRSIRVAPHPQHEAWQATGQLPPVKREFQLIAIPGGGLAAF